MDELLQWLDANHIDYNIRKDVIFVAGWGKALFQDMTKRDHIFKKDSSDNTVFSCIENTDFLIADEIFYVIFKFGNRFFYQDIRESKPNFQLLKYIGAAKKGTIECDFYPLGIHTGYELLNGSGSLVNWCKKAKFLGYKGLGIADRCTMAGTLDLQREAAKLELSHVFGYSLTISVGDSKVGAKIYANTQRGFENMLRIQKVVCVDREDGIIDYAQLVQYADGNCLVFDKWSGQWLVENDDKIDGFMDAFEGFVYFQVDTTEFRANRIDEQTLFSIKAFFEHFYMFSSVSGEFRGYLHDLRPVLIQDVYYLDADDWKNKVVLNKVDTGAAHEQSFNQYMKTLDELYDEFRVLFSEKYGDDVFFDMCESTVEIAENSDAAYDLTANYAPKYIMTEDEIVRYGDTHNMFLQLIEEGFEELVPKGQEEIYRERVEYEKYVIESTDNCDYYLITWDEVNWARKNNILVGVGRGSAGGCVISWLLHITMIDPIKWGLLFERFLLPERGGLEPDDVTKMQPEVMAHDYVELTLDNGRTYKFDYDAQFRVKRGDEMIEVYADELQEGDDIIWDRKDELFTINEK